MPPNLASISNIGCQPVISILGPWWQLYPSAIYGVYLIYPIVLHVLIYICIYRAAKCKLCSILGQIQPKKARCLTSYVYLCLGLYCKFFSMYQRVWLFYYYFTYKNAYSIFCYVYHLKYKSWLLNTHFLPFLRYNITTKDSCSDFIHFFIVYTS